MLVIYLSLLLQFIYPPFVKTKIFGVDIFYYILFVVLIEYIYVLFFDRKSIRINKYNIFAMLFSIFGFIIIFLSIIGIHPFINNTEILVDKSYVIKQSYYFAFFPLFFIKNKSEIYKKIESIIYKNKLIIVLIMLLYSIYFEFNNYSTFVIGLVILYKMEKNKKDIALSIIFIICLFIRFEQLTSLLLGILFVVIFMFNTTNIKEKLYSIINYAFIFCVLFCFIVPFINYDFSNILDKNSNWRLLYWKDELTQLIKTYGFGVGYGTSYATLEFAKKTALKPLGAFSANENYSVMQQIFVTGSHNSFISVAFRTGFVGALLFVSFVVNLSKEIMKNHSKLSASIIFTFYASIIIIATNVGLESPMYLTIFVFGVGSLLKELNEKIG